MLKVKLSVLTDTELAQELGDDFRYQRKFKEAIHCYTLAMVNINSKTFLIDSDSLRNAVCDN